MQMVCEEGLGQEMSFVRGIYSYMTAVGLLLFVIMPSPLYLSRRVPQTLVNLGEEQPIGSLLLTKVLFSSAFWILNARNRGGHPHVGCQVFTVQCKLLRKLCNEIQEQQKVMSQVTRHWGR